MNCDEQKARDNWKKGKFDDLFKVALAGPLAAALKARPPPCPFVIVINALDELDAGSTRAQLRNLVGRKLPTLPDCVRVIVTSRSEDDIVQSFASLAPLELANSDQRQQDDLHVFIKSQIIAETSLAQWPVSSQADLIEFVLAQSDDVFLAVQLAQRAIVLRYNDYTKVGKMLSLPDVKQPVGKGLECIYATYRKTLDRI